MFFIIAIGDYDPARRFRPVPPLPSRPAPLPVLRRGVPRPRTGGAYFSAGRWYARVRLAPKLRPSIPLPTFAADDEAGATARAHLLAELGARLVKAGHVEHVRGFLVDAGAAADGKALATVRRAVDAVCSGKAEPVKPKAPAPTTIRQLGEQWTSGELHRLHPDHIALREDVATDRGRLEHYVYPVVRDVPVRDFTLDHAQEVMRRLPERLEVGTRRQVAAALHRLLALAVFPLRLREFNPLPKGFLPSPGPARALGYLYPDEDRKLLASPEIPLTWRVFYGFLNREGPRSSEAIAFLWSSLDLARGAVTLDENKTDDPRAWALSPGVAVGMTTWKELRREAGDSVDDADPVFPVNPHHLAKQFREHLKAAGVTRANLYEKTAARRPIRIHDTRATFVTIALANGKTESWIADRTGHRSSQMIQKYRRAARTVAELGLGELEPLVDAIPELAARKGGRKGGAGADFSESPRKRPRAIVTLVRDEARVSSRGVGNTEEMEGGQDVAHPLARASAQPEPASAPSPRGFMLRQLAAALVGAAEAGDMDAARIAHRAIGDLLGSE